MRVLIVVHAYPPEAPGAWTSNHVGELSRRHSVWVYSRSDRPDGPDYLQWEEQRGAGSVRFVRHTRFDPFHRFSGFTSAQFDDQLLAFVDEVAPDVVHFEHFFGLSAASPRKVSERGVPTVLSLYDYWTVCQRVHLVRADGEVCDGPDGNDCVACVEQTAPRPDLASQRLRKDHRAALMREAVASADVVTACSPHLRRRLTQMLDLDADRIRSVELGTPPLAGPVIREPAPRVRVTLLGGGYRHKGAHVLAEACGLLSDVDVSLTVYGHTLDADRADVEAIFGGVVWGGTFSRDELPSLLSRTDILVVPSLAAETFSFAVREAALGGVAVVASDVGAIPDFVVDGQSGLLVRPGDAADLARAIRQLATDRPLRERLAAHHRPIRTVAEYTTEMETIYAEAIAARRGVPA